MKGLDWNNPYRVRTPDELIHYIDEVGFLPLFAGNIPDFSVEEHVSPDFWWTGDPEQDPWEWREIIARSGKVAYGKFFQGKAGFISKEWFPYFANARRDGYDFEGLWDDQKASFRSKKIMDLFSEPGRELYGSEIRRLAGFGKEGEKNFAGVMTQLQMQMFLVVRDLRQKTRKDGMPYGWPVSVYATPETLFGEDHVMSRYDEKPSVSFERIVKRVNDLFYVPWDCGVRDFLK